MYRILISLALLTVGVAASAQDWVEHGGSVYNCKVLNGILADYGSSGISRSGDRVMTVAEMFAMMFPSCPAPTGTTSSETPTIADPGRPVALFSFSSDEHGLQPVLGPLTLRAGVYVFTAITEGYMTVAPKSLSGDCGIDLIVSIFNLSRGQGADGAQSVAQVDNDCNLLFEIGNTNETWALNIVSSSNLTAQSFTTGFVTNSIEMGLQPVLGPLTLTDGVYIFTATTDGFMRVSPQSLSGDCGLDLSVSIFNLSSGEASQGAQSVVEVERDCDVLLEIGNTREYWQLEINKLS